MLVCKLVSASGLVIQTTEGRKDLGNIHVDALEILRFALDDSMIPGVTST